MPLTPVKTSDRCHEAPAEVTDFLRDADRRIEQFLNARSDRPIPGFVPSDFIRVYRMLRSVREAYLAPGDRFCEWGSGFGVAACLAAMLGFEASGIEINAELVECSERLVDDYGLSVRLARGTFIPPGGESFTDRLVDFTWLEEGGACGYEELGFEPADLDVVFAYPWPGEERVVVDLFEHFAADGALLLTYHGLEDLQLQRKVGG